MFKNGKQPMSIRLGASDVGNVKRLAKRLGVRDSDIVRYAVKSMLGRIAPLCDERIVGRRLVPVLVESGDELIRYFELDSYRLESIINEHADERTSVERDDIALLAMSALRDQYLLMRIKEGSVKESGVKESSSNESGDAVPATSRSLRDYLYDKYTLGSPEKSSPDKAGRDNAVADYQQGVSDDVRVRRQRPAA